MTLIEKVKELCPGGYSGGNILLIVGWAGLTIQWINPDITVGQVYFNENDTVSLIRIVHDKFEICENGILRPTILLPFHFKGLKYSHWFNPH